MAISKRYLVFLSYLRATEDSKDNTVICLQMNDHIDIYKHLCSSLYSALHLIQVLLIQKSCSFRQVIMVPADPNVFTLYI